MVTFGHTVRTIYFHENVRSLEVHDSWTIQEHSIRLDIILNMNKIMSSPYLP